MLASTAAAAGASALGFPVPLLGQTPGTMQVLSTPSHSGVIKGGAGGSPGDDWQKKNGVKIEWIEFDITPLRERLFRELSLGSTEIDMSFFWNPWAEQNAFKLLEPLNAYMDKAPIEDFKDFFANPVKTSTYDGQLYAIPIRQNMSGVHYNEEFFSERGLSGPPKTIEEFVEYAKKLTYTRPDGTPVSGFIMPNQSSNYTNFARAWDADFITEDYKVVANDTPMVKAITALRELFKAGVYPRQFPTLMQDDSVTWMHTGRGAMVVTTMSRNPVLNDPKKSMFPGKIKVVPIPVTESLTSKYGIAPVGVTFWSMSIPKNSKNKELAWDFIRYISSKENVRRLALNGNGPTRASLYDDPSYVAAVPYAVAEKDSLKIARPPMPAFANAAKAEDLIIEECEAAILGVKEPQRAMDDLARRLKPLMPA
jgi:multiple sugar transport system substrate-binding protein